jgi:opacity protein-like surface antigen
MRSAQVIRRTTFIKMQGAGTAFTVAAALILGACAPLPQQSDADAAAAASAASAASAAQAAQAAKPPAPPAPPGEQRIMVGTPNGYHLMIKATPPSQVCDNDAFADGVRYGYAQTWNRLVGEEVRNGGKAKRKFDAAALRSQDEQYKIQWNGKERVNACASDGYLIGRVVGTHLAGVDMRGGKPS